MEFISLIVLVLDSWLSFVRGNTIFIPTTASENTINASWLIIIGVRNDGLGVPCSTCSNLEYGFLYNEDLFCSRASVFMSDLRFSFNFFARSLFSCLAFLSFLEFIFLSLLWPPSESANGGQNSLPLSVFAIGVGGCFGMIPGVLLHIMRACTLGVARMLMRVVGVNDVCALFYCCVSKISVALSDICATFSKTWPCLPVFIVGSIKIFWMAFVSDPAIFTALYIGVSLGIWT